MYGIIRMLELKEGLIFCFFQAEDGIRDDLVTGVQTCALPISHESPFCTESIYARARSNSFWRCRLFRSDRTRSKRETHERSEERRVGKECRCGWGRDE